MDLKFEMLQVTDLAVMCDIYNYYVKHSTATFHTQSLTVDEFATMLYLENPKYPAYRIVVDGTTCGYCYLVPFKPREAYNRTAEVTIYIHPNSLRRGLGKACLKKLEAEANYNGISVVIGIISGENEASIHLFNQAGYVQCAHYRQVGEKFGRVLDVVAYQKILSPT